MKKLTVLYLPSNEGHACEKLFDGTSAFERAKNWVNSADNSGAFEIIMQSDLQSNNQPATFPALLHKIDEYLQKHDAHYVVFAWGDCPFLNKNLTEKLIEYHTSYRAEYTFAEGYPYGFAPEIIDAGTLRLLCKLAESKDNAELLPIDRESFFSLIKTDINSFEIETVISDIDWRYLRLKFCCDTKRNMQSCVTLYEQTRDFTDVHSLSLVAEQSAKVQRTLPAFYNIQLFSCRTAIYDPPVEQGATDFMQFQTLLADIATFSDDAVISLSFLGDPLYHKDFLQCAKAVLQYENFSLLIETDALCFTPEIGKSIQAIVGDNALRKTGERAVNWIIRLDASNESLYQDIHIDNHCVEDFSLAKAEKATEILKTMFPGAVYPQTVRMKCNEEDLESFFRKWKMHEKGEVIVQKYDYISGLLSDERPVDLSPAKRYACWHIKRDMNILADGSVVRCKAGAFKTSEAGAVLGNAFSEPLDVIWARGEKNLTDQLNGHYKGQCGESDEYYTFNF